MNQLAIAQPVTGGHEVLENIMASIERDESKAYDFVVHPASISFDVDNNNHIVMDVNSLQTFVNQDGFADLLEYAGIPNKFGRKLKEDYPNDFLSIFNKYYTKKAEQSETDRLIRVVSPSEKLFYTRAFLSNRYDIYMNNRRILENVLAWVQRNNIPAENIRYTYQPFESLSVDVILNWSNINDEDIGFGFRTYNDEIGHHSMLVDMYLFVLICLNGAKVRRNVAYQKGVHLGDVLESGIYTHTHRQTYNAQNGVHITSPLTDNLMNSTIEKLKALNDTAMLKAPSLETIEAVNNRYNLGTQKHETANIHRIFSEPNKFNYQRPMNAWGYYNAVTETAKGQRDEHGLIVKSENILNNPQIWNKEVQ